MLWWWLWWGKTCRCCQTNSNILSENSKCSSRIVSYISFASSCSIVKLREINEMYHQPICKICQELDDNWWSLASTMGNVNEKVGLSRQCDEEKNSNELFQGASHLAWWAVEWQILQMIDWWSFKRKLQRTWNIKSEQRGTKWRKNL